MNKTEKVLTFRKLTFLSVDMDTRTHKKTTQVNKLINKIILDSEKCCEEKKTSSYDSMT